MGLKNETGNEKGDPYDTVDETRKVIASTFNAKAGVFKDGCAKGVYNAPSGWAIESYEVVFTHDNRQMGSETNIWRSDGRKQISWELWTGTWGGIGGEIKVTLRKLK